MKANVITKWRLLREAFIFLGTVGLAAAIFYISLNYPPFPEPVRFEKPGVTRLDMPPSEENLVPDFLTGAIYNRSDIEEVHNKRRQISKLALLIFAMYPIYALARLAIWVKMRLF